MAYIETIGVEESQGKLRNIYDDSLRRAGRVYNIVRLMSVNPAVLETSLGLYASIMHGPSGLSRVQREMIATVVSRANDCYY